MIAVRAVLVAPELSLRAGPVIRLVCQRSTRCCVCPMRKVGVAKVFAVGDQAIAIYAGALELLAVLVSWYMCGVLVLLKASKRYIWLSPAKAARVRPSADQHSLFEKMVLGPILRSSW